MFTNLYLRANNWLQDSEGQDLVEYALIIALVSIALIAALALLSGGIQNVFQSIQSVLETQDVS